MLQNDAKTLLMKGKLNNHVTTHSNHDNVKLDRTLMEEKCTQHEITIPKHSSEETLFPRDGGVATKPSTSSTNSLCHRNISSFSGSSPKCITFAKPETQPKIFTSPRQREEDEKPINRRLESTFDTYQNKNQNGEKRIVSFSDNLKAKSTENYENTNLKTYRMNVKEVTLIQCHNSSEHQKFSPLSTSPFKSFSPSQESMVSQHPSPQSWDKGQRPPNDEVKIPTNRFTCASAEMEEDKKQTQCCTPNNESTSQNAFKRHQPSQPTPEFSLSQESEQLDHPHHLIATHQSPPETQTYLPTPSPHEQKNTYQFYV